MNCMNDQMFICASESLIKQVALFHHETAVTSSNQRTSATKQ